jgi:mono/diheme cytochrome c family protein
LRNKALLLVPVALATVACRQDMHDQPKFKGLQESGLWADGRAARPLVEGTVARGRLRIDAHKFQGRQGAAFAAQLPGEYKVDEAFLLRGQSRFNIYCTPCHGMTGHGDGMVVQRGLKAPPSYHIDRLRNQSAGYFFDVMTNGYGVMVSYASRIPVDDRWAIVAYVRALQLSQNAQESDVPEDERKKLAAGGSQ